MKVSAVLRLLDTCKITVTSIADDEIRCLCPLHEDNRTSMSINCTKEKWICFKGCGQGSLRSLFKKLSVDIDTYYDDEPPELKIDAPNIVEYKSFIPDDAEVCPELYSRLSRRSISRRTVNKFGFLYSKSSRAVLAPVNDIFGNCKGWVYIYDAGWKINRTSRDYLFGVNVDATKNSPLVLVEGVYDCTSVWQAGYRCGAILGCSISEYQVLQALAVSKDIVLFMDFDDAGKRGAVKIARYFFDTFGVDVNIVVPEFGGSMEGKDPNDFTKGQIVSLIRSTWKFSNIIVRSVLSYTGRVK